MSDIHQIYVTHCTHGSSALERREGELAHRMLGYSARAGSLEATSLRRYYRQIERYVYYYLPRDTPAEEKLYLTASTAPRRLIHLPSAGGLQIAGQICYRSTDTEGRPGSYFAHVLFAEVHDAAPRWSALDTLRLWSAPGWVEEDTPALQFLLPPLAETGELLESRRPAVDDSVLSGFLTAAANGSFDDRAHVIPARIRALDAPRRRQLLTDVLEAALEVLAGQYDALLLVAEPELAALVYYGLFRLLPPGPLADRLSFCTYEPNPDRLCTTLAATTFLNPAGNDVRPETYRSRTLVINTYLGRRSERKRPSAYAAHVVARLAEQGWVPVDRMLSDVESCAVRDPQELDQLAAVERMAPTLWRSPTPPDPAWRQGRLGAEYLRRLLALELAGLPDVQGRLQPIVGMPLHMLIIELLGGTASPSVRAGVEYLLTHLPPAWGPDLLNFPQVAIADKAEVLARHIRAQGDLPAGCGRLWKEAEEALAAHRRADDNLLAAVLLRLDAKTVERFYLQSGFQHGETFFLALLLACRQKSDWGPLSALVCKLDDAALCRAVAREGVALLDDYPAAEPSLGKRIRQMLADLPRQADHFSERIDLVLAGRRFLADDAQRRRAEAWDACRQAIQEVGRLSAERGSATRRRGPTELEPACDRMAWAIAAALPLDDFDDDQLGTAKQTILRKLGPHVLQGAELLPPGIWEHEALWQKIQWRLSRGEWPTMPLEALRRKASRGGVFAPRRPAHAGPPASRWMWAFALSGAAALLVVLIFALWRMRAGSQEAEENSAAKPAPAARPPVAPAPKPTEFTFVKPQPLSTDAPEKVPPPPAIPANSLQDDERWLSGLREAAVRDKALFLDREPYLPSGVAIAGLPKPLDAQARLALLFGCVHCKNGNYRFGSRLDVQSPAEFQPVPDLARQIGEPEATVMLAVVRHAEGAALVFQLAPPVDADPRLLQSPQWAERVAAAQRALAAVCKEISAVIYLVPPKPGGANLPPAAAAAPPSAAPPSAARPEEDRFPVFGTPAVHKLEEAFAGEPGEVAEIRIRVSDPDGIPLTLSLKSLRLVVRWTAQEIHDDGEPRMIAGEDLKDGAAVRVRDGTRWATIRFWFLRPADVVQHTERSRIGSSPECRIQPVDEKGTYSVQLKLSADDMARIRQATGAAAGRQSF